MWMTGLVVKILPVVPVRHCSEPELIRLFLMVTEG